MIITLRNQFIHYIPSEVSKKKKKCTCMLTWEMRHDFIILTTFSFNLFSQGDVHESFILFKSEKLNLKLTCALENIHDTNHDKAPFQNLWFRVNCKF